MINKYSRSLNQLISSLHRLPGIGPKMAQRLAFHILKTPREESEGLVRSIIEVKERIKNCSVCGNFTEKDPCPICEMEQRDKSLICIVEEPQDIVIIEKTGKFNGLYHVLMGTLSPIDGIGPDQLRIKELIERVKKDKIKEVIIATNPDAEGEATSTYLNQILKPMRVKVTRIAYGIPMGGDLEYADEVTLSKALDGRIEL